MKIHFTKKEYRSLLDLITIAEWIMNSHKMGDDPSSEPHEQIEQKILSYAKDFGFENLIAHDKNNDKYSQTREYEDAETFMSFVEEFEEESFWDKLCTRLAQRDLLQELGVEKIKAMDLFERLTKEDEIAVKYNEEFIRNGLKNLIVYNKET
ncbi:MAG: hypothetical protein RQ824_04280 [bacterium]|nr:hypothetical protein [bacterium]